MFYFNIIVEGGCSIPNAVRTEYDGKCLKLSGILLNLDGSRYVKDHIENLNISIPMTTPIASFLVSQTDDDLLLTDDEKQMNKDNLKRKHEDSDNDGTLSSGPSTSSSISSPQTKSIETTSLLRHFAYVCCVNVDETILENAELCGTNLAVKLMQMGADTILEEIRQKVPIIPIKQ